MNRYEQRRGKLRKILRSSGVDNLLVTDFTNVTYLTGFTGDDSYLIITPADVVILTDGRYTEQLSRECPDLDVEVRMTGTTLSELTQEMVGRLKIRRLGLESDSATLGFYQRLQETLGGVELIGTSGLVLQLREIKDSEELREIRQAVEIAQRAFIAVRAQLRPELTEKAIADELDHQIRLFGGEGCSFPAIVGVGPNGALPHYRAGNARIAESPFVLIDWGARGGQYVSDLTRVLVTGKIPPKLERLYGVVLSAQKQAIEAIRPGARMQDVDAAARGVIQRAGYGKQFSHSLGHGIGMAVHESPRLAVKQDRPLKAGMVVTVEPGIYLSGWGGIRIEDDVLVTRSGHEVLSTIPKEFADCVVV